MDESDIKEIGKTTNKENINEDILRNGLEVNKETNRKGKGFKTYRKLTTEVTAKESSDYQTHTTVADSQHVKITVLDRESFRTTALPIKRFGSTTVQPETTTANEETEINTTEENAETTSRTKFLRTTTTRQPVTTSATEQALRATTEKHNQAIAKAKYPRTRPTRLPVTSTTEGTEITESATSEEDEQTMPINKFGKTRTTRLPESTTTLITAVSTTENPEITIRADTLKDIEITTLNPLEKIEKLEKGEIETEENKTLFTEQSETEELEADIETEELEADYETEETTTSITEIPEFQDSENETEKTKPSITEKSETDDTSITVSTLDKVFSDTEDEMKTNIKLEAENLVTEKPHEEIEFTEDLEAEIEDDENESSTEAVLTGISINETSSTMKTEDIETTTPSTESANETVTQRTEIITKRIRVTTTASAEDESTTEVDSTTTASTTVRPTRKSFNLRNRNDTTVSTAESSTENFTEFVTESTADKPRRKSFKLVNRPLIKSTTTKIPETKEVVAKTLQENATKRTYSHLNHLRTSTAKTTKEEEDEVEDEDKESIVEPRIESSTRKSFLQATRSRGILARTTTTEAPVIEESSSRPSPNRLIRYRTTTYKTNEVEENDAEETESDQVKDEIEEKEIQTSTRRSYGTLQQRPNVSPTRRAFGGIDRLRISTTEASQEEEDESTSEDDSEDPSEKVEITTEQTLRNRKPFTGLIRPISTTTVSSEIEAEGEEVTTERNLPRKTFGFVRSKGSTTENPIEIDTTEIASENDSKEDVSTKSTLLTRLPFGALKRYTTTPTPALSELHIDDNVTETTSEKTSEQEEVSAKRTLSTRRPFSGFNRSASTTTAAALEFEKSTSTVTENSFEEEEISTKRTLPTRRPFGGVNRSSTTTTETLTEAVTDDNITENVSETEEISTKRTLPSRRPFPGLNRSTSSTTEASLENENSTSTATESSFEEEEISTKRTLPTRRPFGGLNRSSTTTTTETLTEAVTDDNITENVSEREVISTKRILPTRRPFEGLNKYTTSTTSASPEGTIDDNATESVSEKLFAQKEVSTKRTLSILRPFPGLNRSTSSTTEASLENENSTAKVTENSFEEEEISTKRNLPSRRPFGGLNRSSTTTTTELPTNAVTDDNVTENFSEKEKNSTKRILPTRRAFDGFNRSTTTTVGDRLDNESSILTTTEYSEEANKEIERISVNVSESLDTSSESTLDEESVELTTPVATVDSSTPRRKVIIRKRIRLPTTTANTPTTEKSEEGNKKPDINESLDMEHTTSATKTPNSESTEANEASIEVSTSKPVTSVTEESIESPSVINESLSTRKPFLPTNRPHALFIRTTTKAPGSDDKPQEADKEEDEIISEVPQTDSTTRKPFNRLNRFQVSRESSVKGRNQANEEIHNDSTTKRSFTRFNRLKSTTDTLLTPKAEIEEETLQSEEPIEVSTRRSIGSFSQRQRFQLNTKTQTETTTQSSKLNINKNVYNNRNKQEEEEENDIENTEEVTSRRTFGSFRKQRINSNSQLELETRPSLKPFNLNRPQFKRPLRPNPDQNQEEEYDENDEEEKEIDSNTDETEDEYVDEDDNSSAENKDQLASKELASKEPSSSLFNLRNRVRLGQTQEKDSQQGLVNDRLKNLLITRAKTQTTDITNASKTSDLTQEDNKEVAITSDTNPNSIRYRYGTNRSNSTVANYLNRVKTNLSPTTTNQAPSHINEDKDNEKDNNEEVDNNDDEEEEEEDSDNNSNKLNVNDNKGNDNDSKRRFQKYQFQRRTTTTKTTTTTERPVESNEDNDDEEDVVTKAQVNVNENERESSTNIPETTAPTTESPSSPATPLARRIKVLKLKRPVVTNSNNTTAFASSATNFNASHTETQNIVKLSSVSEVDEQLVKTHTLTDTETHTEIPSQTSPTPKRFRKVIRKLIRPVNRTAIIINGENSAETSTSTTPTSTLLQRKQSNNRFGLNRSSKFSLESQKSVSVEEKEEKEEAVEDQDITEERTSSTIFNRGKNKFTLPSAVTSSTRSTLYGTANRNRFANRQQSSTTTTEGTKTSEENEEEDEEGDGDEDDQEEDEEDVEEQVKETTPFTESKATGDSKYTSTNRFRFSKTSSTTTETPLGSNEKQEEANTEDSTASEIETTAQDETKENSSSKFLDLQKIRNKVRIDSSKQQDLGVLSDRFKTIKSETEEEQTVDPLLKLRNKVKQELAQGDQDKGVLSDRFKSSKSNQEVEEVEDPLLKLRSKVKQDLAKGNTEDGVVNFKLKKLLETKTSTNTLNYKVEDSESDSTTAQESLNLQKIRDKVQINLAKGEQDQGVVSSRLKKLLSERTSSIETDSNTLEEESTTEIKESSGEGDLVEAHKPFTPRRPYVPNDKTRLTQVDNDSSSQSQEVQESSTSAPKVKPTFRRKLIAKRPYTPTKPSLSAIATSTVKIPTTKGKTKFVRRKFGRFHPFNASNRNTGDGFVRKDPRGNILPGTDRYKVEGSAGGQNGEGEEYEEYDEEDEVAEEEEDEEQHVVKPVQSEKPTPSVRPAIARPPGLFNRPQSSILKKPTQSKEQGSGENDNEEEEEEDEIEDADEEEEEEEEEKELDDGSAIKQTETSSINRPNYKPKDNRIPPGARPTLATTNSNKPSFTRSRFANKPNDSKSATTPEYNGNRFGSSARSTVKPRVVNRPPGVAAPNLTLKPVATDYERTTVLIPTKPAPFINHNTHAYERKYSGPSTEASIAQDNDNNPLIEDLNVEALNARNKKIFDTHSKKHTQLKQKVLIPFGNLNENTQQQQFNTENEYDVGYQSSLNGYATTTITNTPLATQDNTIIGTHNTDDENQSNVINLNEISSQDDSTTTPPPSTTLLHIFTLSDDEHTTRNPLEDANLVVTRHGEKVKPKHKVVEINRIVEVNSKEEKLRRKSKANTIRTVEGSQTFKVESLPHIEQLGEISVVKYVHQVDGSDITIEGRSTVTDYTPTEPTIATVSQPVRNTNPEGNVQRVEERYAKALLPELLREAVETSTISLEGLFEHARKGKVLNTIDDVSFAQQQGTNAESFKALNIESSTESSQNQAIENSTEQSKITEIETSTESSKNQETATSTESFNILKSVAFDVAKINLETNSAEIETSMNTSKSSTSTSESSSSASSTTVTKQESSAASMLTTTTAPETLNVESSTVASEEMKATTVAAALFPQYLHTPTTASINSLTVTRRPVLSVRRRLINSPTAAATTTTSAAAATATHQTTTPAFTTQQVSSSTGNVESITTSKFKRLRTNRPPSLNSAAVDITSETTAASFKASNKLKKKSSETLAHDLKLASSSLTSSSSVDNDITAKQTTKYPSSQQTSAALRRKFQSRRLTTTIASNTNSDGTATELPRTQNPLFKRRFSLTTFSPLAAKTVLPSKAATTLRTAIDSLTTTVYVDGLENDEATDQVAKSSIHTSLFNQINGRPHIDDDDEELVGGGGGNVADVRHVVNTVKPITTTLSVATATRQPTTRFLQQQQQQQQQQSSYNFEDVITRRMDGTGTVLKASTTTTSTTTQTPVIKKRKMIIKRRPQKATPSSVESTSSAVRRRKPHDYQEPFQRINSNQSKAAVKPSQQPGRTYRPNLDYDYYDDEDVRLVGNRSDNQLKVILHGGGIIECLDHGNFPHPLSCRKFISCAKYETGGVVGWEYTCPKGLSYDPVGGMCNWAAGLGCKE